MFLTFGGLPTQSRELPGRATRGVVSSRTPGCCDQTKALSVALVRDACLARIIRAISV